MTLTEALALLWFDSIVSTMLIPVRNAYVFTVMRVFSENYPLYFGCFLVATGAVMGMIGNWWLGKIAISLGTSFGENTENEKLSERFKTPHTTLEKIKAYWKTYGQWSLIIVTLIPYLGQAFAVLSGWSRIPLKRLILPTFLGALAHALLLVAFFTA